MPDRKSNFGLFKSAGDNYSSRERERLALENKTTSKHKSDENQRKLNGVRLFEEKCHQTIHTANSVWGATQLIEDLRKYFGPKSDLYTTVHHMHNLTWTSFVLEGEKPVVPVHGGYGALDSERHGSECMNLFTNGFRIINRVRITDEQSSSSNSISSDGRRISFISLSQDKRIGIVGGVLDDSIYKKNDFWINPSGDINENIARAASRIHELIKSGKDRYSVYQSYDPPSLS